LIAAIAKSGDSRTADVEQIKAAHFSTWISILGDEAASH